MHHPNTQCCSFSGTSHGSREEQNSPRQGYCLPHFCRPHQGTTSRHTLDSSLEGASTKALRTSQIQLQLAIGQRTTAEHFTDSALFSHFSVFLLKNRFTSIVLNVVMKSWAVLRQNVKFIIFQYHTRFIKFLVMVTIRPP